MSRLPEPDGVDRFPGFDVMAQARHWDPATTAVVAARLGTPADIRFFTPQEEAVAAALCDQLLDQRTEPRVPVVAMVDARLAERQTDGWHHEDMPPDGEAWRESLSCLDADAELRCGTGFVAASWEDQTAIVQGVQDLGTDRWHRLVAEHVWSLWTRYVCTAFYSHPWAWQEIGFGGPAYPRGYKNLGLDRREPYEVRDAHPGSDPAKGTGR
jgi:hypothetical protein